MSTDSSEGRFDFSNAQKTISQIAIRTPVLPSLGLSERLGAPVVLKLENLQVTGSFKVRGAVNKLSTLNESERSSGVVACSSGNHGLAVAYVAERLGIPATVCVPNWVDATKLEAIRRHGAETVLYGNTYDEAEARALEIRSERDLVYVSPFDDPDIIAGQGTIGLELLEEIPSLQTVIVPLSGGGLIAGVGLAMKSQQPDMRVIGVSANNARVMFESLAVGQPTAFPEDQTVATALSGGIGLDNRYTFALVRKCVDEHVLVTENQIRAAMEFMIVEHKLIVEGGGAVAVAAVLADQVHDLSGPVGIVVSGGNIDLSVLTQLVSART